jgi:hypothetical protein
MGLGIASCPVWRATSGVLDMNSLIRKFIQLLQI